MAALMQPFISETIRVITEALRAPAHCESETAPHVSATRHRLDASIAETVSNGSVIFRHPGGESEPDPSDKAAWEKRVSERNEAFT